MFARLLYWFELSIAFIGFGYLFLAEEWGRGLEPITQLLLFNKTPQDEALWMPLEPGISRLWDLMVAPLLALTIILHDEKDDFIGTLGFVCFGLLAYVFIYIRPDLMYGFYFLMLVAVAIGTKATPLGALRIGYTTLALTFSYTWLFPNFSIGLVMFGGFTIMFVILIVGCQVFRLVFNKLQISAPRAT